MRFIQSTAQLQPLLIMLSRPLMILLLNHSLDTKSQTWEQSNDPDNICHSVTTGTSYTGYKSTPDCRGYVYCSDGYLMGGGIISCWPNQLFDETNAVCTSWQSVVDALGDKLSEKCPKYDGTLMMPDDVDSNANPDRFFCGVSTSNAKQVCEPCPGGSRLECSDPTHSCWAGVTGCPTNLANPSSSVTSSSEISSPGTPSPIPNPSTPLSSRSNSPETQSLTLSPTVPEVNAKLTNSQPTLTPNKSDFVADDFSDDTYLHGKLRTSYYCGWSWALVIKTCNMAEPCPSGLNTECPSGQTCFPDTPCESLQTPPPTPKATPNPTTIKEATYFCGFSWSWVVDNCDTATPCPNGNADGVCLDGMNCIADTPCHQSDGSVVQSHKPTPLLTNNLPLSVKGDDPSKRYCGYNWTYVTENCLTAVACPSGDAAGVCPDDMNCIAETLCTDSNHLDWLMNKQIAGVDANSNDSNSPSQAPSSPNTSVVGIETENVSCVNDSDCNTRRFCNRGYCGSCLDDGTGCSVDQICRVASCGESQVAGATKCYFASDLDNNCQLLLNDTRAACDSDRMTCEIVDLDGKVQDVGGTTVSDSDDTPTIVNDSGSSEVSMYENPVDNEFFCGIDYYAIKTTCLQSKPCPGGFSTGVCDSDQGCFSVIECTSEYEAAGSTAVTNPQSVTLDPSLSPTDEETSLSTSLPTSEPVLSSFSSFPSVLQVDPVPLPALANSVEPSQSSHSSFPSMQQANLVYVPQQTSLAPIMKPTVQPSLFVSTIRPTLSHTKPVEKAFTSIPTSQNSTLGQANSNTNFCGQTWSSHLEDCANAKPCPKGDECLFNETCFSGSPCASLSKNISSIDTNILHLCGTEWNKLVVECTNATHCPNGNECREDEFCYRDFECNPTTALTDTDNEISGTSSETQNSLVLTKDESTQTQSSQSSTGVAEDTGEQGSQFSESDGETSGGSTTATHSSVIVSATTVTGGDDLTATTASSNVVNTMTTSTQIQVTSQINTNEAPFVTHCDLCDSAGHFDYLRNVRYEGNEMPCGELIWVFAESNIFDGSNECLQMRAQYFGECCYIPPENACFLCDSSVNTSQYDLNLNKTVKVNGQDTSCTKVFNDLTSKVEASSQTCVDTRNSHFSDCCFQKCTLCGNIQPNWDASVYFSGRDMKCQEFDVLFHEEGITADSSQCKMSRDLYSEKCCIQPMDEPCNICQSEADIYNMKSDVAVTYDGESSTCFEVYTYLISLKKKSDDQCLNAQKELLSQCCDVPDSNILTASSSQEKEHMQSEGATYNAAPPSSIVQKDVTISPSQAAITSNWYAGSLPSPASRLQIYSVKWIAVVVVVIYLVKEI